MVWEDLKEGLWLDVELLRFSDAAAERKACRRAMEPLLCRPCRDLKNEHRYVGVFFAERLLTPLAL